MLSIDPPGHTRLRRLVGSAFTPRRVASLQPAIERLTADLMDELTPETDFIREFAFPLPIAVIGELLGVPRADQRQFEHLARDWTQVLDVTTPRILAGPIRRRRRSAATWPTSRRSAVAVRAPI